MRLCSLASISISSTLLLSTQLASAAQWVASEAQSSYNILAARQTENLSPCVTKCFLEIFPQFDCPDLTSCVCANKPLQNALATCTIESKCSIGDLLASKKVQAGICGEPVRDRSMTLFATATILFVLAIACATSRALSRGRYFGGAGYGWDDWTLFLCCAPMLGLTVTGYMGVKYGLGQDTWELSVDDIEKCLMLFYVGNTFYAPVVFGTKVAFVLLYLRVWKDGVVFHRVCYVILALLAVALVGFESSTIFLCSPIDYTWKAIRGAQGHCIHRQAQLYTSSSTNVAFDLVVLLLPLPNILALQMNSKKKIGLLFTFVVGFATTAASATQLYYLVTKLNDTQNPTWDFFDIALWRITEMYLSIICCCMPMMAGLGVRSWKRVVSWPSLPSSFHSLVGKSFEGSSNSSMRSWKRATSWSSLPSSFHSFLEKSFGSSSSSSKSKSRTMTTAKSSGSLRAGTVGLEDGRWQQLQIQETELGVVIDNKRSTSAKLETSKGYLQIADRKREIAAAKIRQNAMLDMETLVERDFAQPQGPVAKPVMARHGSYKSESWFKGSQSRAPVTPQLQNLRTTTISLSPPLSPTDESPSRLRRKIVSTRSWTPPMSARCSSDSDTLPHSQANHTAAWSEAETSCKRWSPLDSILSTSSTAWPLSHPLRSDGKSDVFEEHQRPPLEEQTSYERRALPSLPSKAMARLGT